MQLLKIFLQPNHFLIVFILIHGGVHDRKITGIYSTMQSVIFITCVWLCRSVEYEIITKLFDKSSIKISYILHTVNTFLLLRSITFR